MVKHSSLSAADWSLLPVQTCMLSKVMQNCSHSSREWYFPHAVPRRAWVEMREMHEVFSLKTKPPYLIPIPSAALSDRSQNLGVTNLESPGGSHYLSLVFLPQGKWLGLTNFLIPEPSASAERCSCLGELNMVVLENVCTLDGASSPWNES